MRSHFFKIKQNKATRKTLNYWKELFDKNLNQKLKQLKNYDEIILIGSGKGVTTVKHINEIKWKRKSYKFFKKISLIYNREIKKQKNINKFL